MKNKKKGGVLYRRSYYVMVGVGVVVDLLRKGTGTGTTE